MKFQSKNTLLTLLMVGLVSLFAVGCGDSREDYVFTGTNNIGTTGNLLFLFQQPLLAQGDVGTVVPPGTEWLQFDFYSTTTPAQGTYLFSVDRDFATEILIEDVTTNARSVIITAFDDDNIPLGSSVATVQVVPGRTSEVAVPNFGTVTFDAIDTEPNPIFMTEGSSSVFLVTEGTFTPAGGSSVDVVLDNADVDYTLNVPEGMTAPVTIDNETGEVTFNYAGSNATITATYELFGVVRTDVVTVRTFDFYADAAVVAYEEYPADDVIDAEEIDYYASFLDSDGEGYEVTEDVTYSIDGDVEGVEINPVTGDLEFDPEVWEGGTFTVVVTYVDDEPHGDGDVPSEQTFQDEVDFTVAGPVGNG